MFFIYVIKENIKARLVQFNSQLLKKEYYIDINYIIAAPIYFVNSNL